VDTSTKDAHETHTHLPKLQDAGFIEWDRTANAIRPGPQFDEIKPVLQFLQHYEDDLSDD